MFVSSLPEYYILYKLPIRVPTKVQSTTILVLCEKMKSPMVMSRKVKECRECKRKNQSHPYFTLLSPSLTFLSPSLTLSFTFFYFLLHPPPPIKKNLNLTI